MNAPILQKLTNSQIALLELFSFDLSEDELIAMRQALMQPKRLRLEVDHSEKRIDLCLA